MKYLSTIFVIPVLLLVGCATSTVTTPASLSDAVYYSSDPVAKTVNIAFSSAVADTSIRPLYFKKNGEQIQGTGDQWEVNHVNSVDQMFREFISSVFAGPGDDVQVELRLLEVDIRSENQDSGGRQFMVAMAGGELTSIKSVRQRAQITLHYNGEKHDKLLVGTASTSDVDGLGTGTETSNFYRGQQSDEMIYGRLLNDSSNKLVLQASQFIRSLEIE